MHQVAKRFIVNRSQPLAIVSAIFLPDVIGIHIIPWQAALMIFEPIFLLIFAIANFSFFLILDLGNKESPMHLRNFWMIYMLFVGVLSVELLPIYVGVQGSIFYAANAETSQQEYITKLVIAYGFVGSFVLDVYFFFTNKISAKLQSIFGLKKDYTQYN